MIPKIVHQCHTGGVDSLSPEEKTAMSKLRNKNLDWDFKFYDLKRMREFIKEKCSNEYLMAFDKINPSYGVAQADYFRYLVMHEEGGVYLDVKSYTKFPLNNIIHEDDCFVTYSWQNNPRGVYENDGMHSEITFGNEYQQWNITTERHSVYLKNVIDMVTHNINTYSLTEFGVGWKGVLQTTGPIPFTNAINMIDSSGGMRFGGNNEENGLIYRDDINHETRKKNNHYSMKEEPIILIYQI